MPRATANVVNTPNSGISDRDRPVGNQQQHDDQDDRHDCQLGQALIRRVKRVGGQWCGSGDIGIEARGFRYVRNDLSNLVDRLVGGRRTQIADRTHR